MGVGVEEREMEEREREMDEREDRELGVLCEWGGGDGLIILNPGGCYIVTSLSLSLPAVNFLALSSDVFREEPHTCRPVCTAMSAITGGSLLHSVM